MWQLYNRMLTKFPYSSQAVTAVTLGVMGDIISQKVIQKQETIDWARTARFSSLGIFIAPALYRWFMFLDKRFGHGGYSPIKKLVVDQIIMAPTVNAFVVGMLETVHGGSLESVTDKLLNKFPEVLVNSYKLWPAVQLVNFYVVPLKYKILFTSSVAFFWNIYIASTLQAPANPALMEAE